jgi:hypothetical protein
MSGGKNDFLLQLCSINQNLLIIINHSTGCLKHVQYTCNISGDFELLKSKNCPSSIKEVLVGTGMKREELDSFFLFIFWLVRRN